jgi:hypothetical protein
VSFQIYSQNVKDEILNINKAYLKSKDIALETITKAYTEDDSKPEKEMKTELYKLNENYLSKTGASETMINKKYKVNIDVNKKIIIISNINTHQKNPDNSISNFDEKAFNVSMDTVLTLYKEVKINKINATTNQVEFIFKSGIYDIVKVSYDNTTYIVKDYYVKLRPSGKSSKEKEILKYLITYNYFPKEKLQKIKFDESNYVIINKGNVTPVLKYSGFKIINNIKNSL